MSRRFVREDYEQDMSVPEQSGMLPAMSGEEGYPIVDAFPPREAASEMLDEPLSVVGSIETPTGMAMESDVRIGKVIIEKGERIRVLSKQEAKKYREENPIANGGSSEAPMDVTQPNKGEKTMIVVDGSEQLTGGDSLAVQNTADKAAYGMSADAHGDAFTGAKTDKGIGEARAKIRQMEIEIARLKRSLA